MKWKTATAGIALAGVTATGGVFAADRAIDPYTDKGTHFELPITSDIPQGERVEIAKDRAEMTLRGWNDEYAIKIIPQIPTAQLGAADRPFTTRASRPLLSKRMEYKSGAVTAFIEPREGTQNEFDIDFTLESKPDTNVFTYKIEGAEEFDFWYQPELTPEEIAEGAERPENVVGSYAVYHKLKRNNCTNCGHALYQTGKVMHIYRPKAIDANGAEVWARLNYNNGILSVTVPQKFLDDAVYPVVVDPTFGYTSIGANGRVIANDASDQSVRWGKILTFPENGTVQSINIALVQESATDSGDIFVAINTPDSGGTNIHGEVELVERLNLSVSTTPAWYEFTFPDTALIGSTSYLFNSTGDGEDAPANNRREWRYDQTGGPTGKVYQESFFPSGGRNYADSKEDPWTDSPENSTQDDDNYSIYATYTASAPATTPSFGDVLFFE